MTTELKGVPEINGVDFGLTQAEATKSKILTKLKIINLNFKFDLNV